MKNIHLDLKTTQDIDRRVDHIHRELGYTDGKVDLRLVRELLRLDLRYYRLDDPGLLDEVVHKLKVGGKQVLERPGLLVEAVRRWDLSALFLPDRNRILIDASVPQLKQRWTESHEIAHSIIPWHGDYMLGDHHTTLSPACHDRIEAEANYGAGRVIFPRARFDDARNSQPLTMSFVRELAKTFGNTITSTLWRCAEQSDEAMFACIGAHPHRPHEPGEQIEYFIRSPLFAKQFDNVTEGDIWSCMSGYCRYRTTGPIGEVETVFDDVNSARHIFFVETFGNGHRVLTLGRRLPAAVITFPSPMIQAA